MPLKGTDYVFDQPPGWLPGPLQKVATDLTYNEAHALLLGCVGLFAGVGWVAGYRDLTAYFTVLTIGMAFGVNERLLARLGGPGAKAREKAKQTRLVRHLLRINPWYYTVPYLLTALLGAGLASL